MNLTRSWEVEVENSFNRFFYFFKGETNLKMNKFELDFLHFYVWFALDVAKFFQSF